jgi:hypothetical protein
MVRDHVSSIIEVGACLVQVEVASDVAFRLLLRGAAACVGWGRRRHIIVVASRRPYLVARLRFLRSLSCVAGPLVLGPVRLVGVMHLHTSALGQVVEAYRLEAASRKARGQGLCCCCVRAAYMGLLLDH